MQSTTWFCLMWLGTVGLMGASIGLAHAQSQSGDPRDPADTKSDPNNNFNQSCTACGARTKSGVVTHKPDCPRYNSGQGRGESRGPTDVGEQLRRLEEQRRAQEEANRRYLESLQRQYDDAVRAAAQAERDAMGRIDAESNDRLRAAQQQVRDAKDAARRARNDAIAEMMRAFTQPSPGRPGVGAGVGPYEPSDLGRDEPAGRRGDYSGRSEPDRGRGSARVPGAVDRGTIEREVAARERFRQLEEIGRQQAGQHAVGRLFEGYSGASADAEISGAPRQPDGSGESSRWSSAPASESRLNRRFEQSTPTDSDESAGRSGGFRGRSSFTAGAGQLAAAASAAEQTYGIVDSAMNGGVRTPSMEDVAAKLSGAGPTPGSFAADRVRDVRRRLDGSKDAPGGQHKRGSESPSVIDAVGEFFAGTPFGRVFNSVGDLEPVRDEGIGLIEAIGRKSEELIKSGTGPGRTQTSPQR